MLHFTFFFFRCEPHVTSYSTSKLFILTLIWTFELVFLSHLYLNEAQELALVPVIACWLWKISCLGSQIGWFFLGCCFTLYLP